MLFMPIIGAFFSFAVTNEPVLVYQSSRKLTRGIREIWEYVALNEAILWRQPPIPALAMCLDDPMLCFKRIEHQDREPERATKRRRLFARLTDGHGHLLTGKANLNWRARKYDGTTVA